jgi:succinate dehydrogenase/fumarate reductase cytochrome b subunit
MAADDDNPIKMKELDPSPVEETPSYDPDLEKSLDPSNPYFPPQSSTHSSTSSTLGLSSSSSRWNLPHILHTLQKYSTVPPSLYLILHYTNTSLIPLLTRSVPASESYLLLTRPYYQSFPLEPLLLAAPIATHVLSGIALRIYHRRQSVLRHAGQGASYTERRSIPWPKLSVQSMLGYMLWPLLAGHVFVNRILPLEVEGGSSGVGLGYVSHGFAKHPVIANLGYAALIGVGSWHVVGGVAKWLKLSKEFVTEGGDYGQRKRRKRGWVVNVVAGVVAGMWMLGGLGVVGRGGLGSGWEAKNWDLLYSRVPIFGKILS